MGGLLGVRDAALAEKIEVNLILTEGFVTYGGLAGRDLEAMAQGLREVLDEHYLEYRFAAAQYLARELEREGLSVVQPTAAHAVYIDAGAALPHLSPDNLPASRWPAPSTLPAASASCNRQPHVSGRAPSDGSSSGWRCRAASIRRVTSTTSVPSRRTWPGCGRCCPRCASSPSPPNLRHFSAAMRPVTPFPAFE